jgi:hypothetical protein
MFVNFSIRNVREAIAAKLREQAHDRRVLRKAGV